MSTELKLRRGTTAQHSNFTGAEGEVTIDSDKDVPVVHDGATQGGFPLAKEFQLNDITSLSSLNTAALVDGQQFWLKEWWPGTGVGGGPHTWRAGEDSANHNGGTIKDPRRGSVLDVETKEFNGYHTAVSGNTGCFVVTGQADVTAYGAVNDGVVDCTAPINASLASQPETELIPGDYLYSDTLRIRDRERSLFCATKHGARLVRTAGTFDGLYAASDDPENTRLSFLVLKNLEFRNDFDMTAGSIINVSDYIHVEISNCLLWNGFISLHLQGVQNTYIESVAVKAGAYWSASAKAGSKACWLRPGAGVKSTEVFFSDFNFTRTLAAGDPIDTVKLERGVEISGVDGVWFSNGHIGPGCTNNMLIRPETTTTQLQGVECDNVWFDQHSDYGVRIDSNSTGGFGDFKFSACRALYPKVSGFHVSGGPANLNEVEVIGGNYKPDTGGNGIEILNGDQFTFSGVSSMTTRAQVSGSRGVIFGGAPRNITFSGGRIGTTITSDPVEVGMELGSPAQNISVTGVHFHGVSDEIQLDNNLRDNSSISGCSSSRDPNELERLDRAAVVYIPAIVSAFDLQTTSGDVTDIQYGWQGRQIMVRSNGITTTLKHDLGASGTTIRNVTGADIVLNTGDVAFGTYQARAGAWYFHQ